MTYRDGARGRGIAARWCNLAERRLDYLTELFESGRWRRYHTEISFLENIQEAKAAVETWRDLLKQESSPENFAISMALLRASRTTVPSSKGFSAPVPRLQPQPAPVPRLQPQPAPVPRPQPVPISVEPLRDIPGDVLIALERQLVVADEAPSAPDAPALDKMPLPALKLDVMKERYPLLRNAL
jgi:uncharacterized repeat protein (TIGR03809 family)